MNFIQQCECKYGFKENIFTIGQKNLISLHSIKCNPNICAYLKQLTRARVFQNSDLSDLINQGGK